jgi:hypothetical protein
MLYPFINLNLFHQFPPPPSTNSSTIFPILSFTMSLENGFYDQEKVDTPIEAQHLEVVRTISRVPGNPNYYEKDGLRTYGDGVDHSHYNTVSPSNLPSLSGLISNLTMISVPLDS